MTMFGVRPSMVNYNPPRKVLVRTPPSPYPPIPKRPGALMIETVCRERRITIADLLGPSRKRHLVDARSEVVHRLRDVHGLTVNAIGRILRRDHKTIHNLIQREAKRMGRHGT